MIEGGKKSLLTLCFDRRTGTGFCRNDFGCGVDQKTHANSNLGANTPAVMVDVAFGTDSRLDCIGTVPK